MTTGREEKKKEKLRNLLLCRGIMSPYGFVFVCVRRLELNLCPLCGRHLPIFIPIPNPTQPLEFDSRKVPIKQKRMI